MLLGTGLAFYLGKPLIQPQAPQLPPIALGGWSGSPRAGRAAGQSAAAAGHRPRDGDALGLRAHALGPAGAPRRRFGERDQGARLFGLRRPYRCDDRRRRIAGLGGASLTLFYPGSWNEGISSGQGLIAVALVIFARWSPWRCVGAALLFGGAGAIGPALQSIGVSQGYYLFGAVPYVLTLVILVMSCRPGSVARGSSGRAVVSALAGAVERVSDALFIVE